MKIFHEKFLKIAEIYFFQLSVFYYRKDIENALYLKDDFLILLVENDIVKKFDEIKHGYIPYHGIGRVFSHESTDYKYGTQTAVLVKGPEELKLIIEQMNALTKYERWPMNLRKVHGAFQPSKAVYGFSVFIICIALYMHWEDNNPKSMVETSKYTKPRSDYSVAELQAEKDQLSPGGRALF